MNDAAPNFVWLACPQCRWRREFPLDQVKKGIRCRQCGNVVVVSPPPGSSNSAPPNSPLVPPSNSLPPLSNSTLLPDSILREDELGFEPIHLPPPSGVQHVSTPTEPDYQLAPQSTPAPPPIVRSDVPRGSVSEQKPRDDTITPPRRARLEWAFTNNVFGFPFQNYALAQWIYSSFGLFLLTEFSFLSFQAFSQLSVGGGMQGCICGILACLALLGGLAYVVNCLHDIIVNAAHNVDKARDWPDESLAERVWCMFRVAWLAVMACTFAIAIAGLGSLVQIPLWPVFVVIAFLLFPILLLAALEADAFFVPISRPIFHSIRSMWHAWLAFHLLTGIIWAAAGALSWALAKHSLLQMPLIGAPLWAAVVFIYGRLLGRLAWFILRKSESQQDDKATQRLEEQRRWEM